jgi:serine/threonine protein kinase
VLARIPAGWRNLASPPSMQSCTRDIYADGWRLPVAAAEAMVDGIASAVRQLHARGIVHGDLYAHNILCDDQGGALLGDFGAASFCPAADALTLQRIEARAFGCLLEELVAHCLPSADQAARATVNDMAQLAQRCLQAEAALRPSFDEIAQTLGQPTQ